LGQSWVTKRMKAIRFALINLPAQVVKCSRYLLVRLSKGHRSFLDPPAKKVKNLVVLEKSSR
jgi:hypothetical protein